MARGRLIFPFLVELAQLDTAATAADPDGAGPLTSGYDDDFREPLMVLASATDQTGASARVESGPIVVRAQIEPTMFEVLEAMMAGTNFASQFAIVLHYRDLETADLLDATTGRPLIYPGDRLARILKLDGTLVEEIADPPGLFVKEVQSRGFGPGGARNLLLLTFESRDQSVRSGSG